MRKAIAILIAFVLAMPLSVIVAESPSSPTLDDVGESIDPGFGSFVKHTLDTSGDVDRTGLTDIQDQGTDRRPQYVFGADERVQITPADSRVAYLEAIYSGVGSGECTGSFIGSNVVLTAAHCLYDGDYGFPDAVEVSPGLDGAATPFGSHWASTAVAHPAWIEAPENSPYDVGLLVFEDHIGQTTDWFDVGLFQDSTLSSSDLGVASIGYPSDKPLGTQWLAYEESLTTFDDIWLLHELDQEFGQSGSALIRADDQLVFGVTSSQADFPDLGSQNVGVRINAEIVAFFDAVCIELQCSFTYFEDPGQLPPDDPQPDPPQPEDPAEVAAAAIARTWAYTDFPVANGDVARTWMWGPEPFEGISEPYIEAPGGERGVIYYDKARMEITDPTGDPNTDWYVTNGLLVQEMINGQVQTGDSSFDDSPNPANVNVAGDPNDPNGPTYASFAGLTGPAAAATGNLVTNQADRNGNVTQDPSLTGQNVVLAHYDDVTGHNVAGPFWNFMNSEGLIYQNEQMYVDDLFTNPYYATGRPITEPYFANVQVGGTVVVVLMQCFERRCLTYTPTNPAGYQVEAGNVGLHYYCWRYGELPEGKGGCSVQEDPAPDPPSEPDPEPDPDPDPDPEPEPPEPDPGDGVPAEGEIIGYSDLTDWFAVETPFGDSGAPTANGYAITNVPGSFMQVFAEGEDRDASSSIWMRVTDPAPLGYGCVLVRMDPSDDLPLVFNDSAYHFCVGYGVPEGGSDPIIVAAQALYETGDELIDLGFWELEEPVSASSWNELKIIAQGDTLWFFLNDSLAGPIEHNGATSGMMGFSAWDLTDTDETRAEIPQVEEWAPQFEHGANLQQAGGTSQVEFTDLTVRELQ